MESYNADPTRCADLINGSIFQGKQIVDANYLEYCPRKKAIIAPSNTIFHQIKVPSQEKNSIHSLNTKEENISNYLVFLERERDLLRLHNQPENKFYIACEAQSYIDYTISIREFTYDGIEYSDQLKSKRHKHKKNGQVKYLLPVLHVVLYHGEKKWLSKHNLQETMDIPEKLLPFRHLFPDYRSYIIDIHEQNPEYFTTEWADIFRLMKHSRKKEELKQYMKEHSEEIRQLSTDTRILLAILLDQYQIMDDGRIEVNDVSKVWDGALELMREEIREEITKEVRDEVTKEVRDEVTKEVRDEVTKEVAAQTEEQTLDRVSRLFSFLKHEKRWEDFDNTSLTGNHILSLLKTYDI